MFAMHSVRKSAAAAVVTFLGVLALPPALSMQKRTPTLDEVLQALETNLQNYDRNIPGFFCDEHVVSQIFPGTRRDITVTDSVFRLKRVVDSDHATSFVESREVKSVNSGPAGSSTADPPALLDGAFEGALAVVSASQQACMRYDLKRNHGAYIVEFKTRVDVPRKSDCLLQEKAHGRAYVDAVSMQITRLELTTPHHMIKDDAQSGWSDPLKGEWVLAVDYASVLLDDKSFWMPATITSRVTSDPNSFHSRTWLFKATYRDFHKLEVTSRVVPP
jgi:hypothetical protein